MDLEEDIGLLIIDYDVDGSEGIGGISNADKSMIKHNDLLDYVFDKQQFDNPSDIVEFIIKFTVLTELCRSEL